MMKPSAIDHAPPTVTAANVWRDVPEPSRSLTTNGFQRQTTAVPVAAFCHRKDFYSRLILDVLEIDRVELGRISCFASGKPAVANYFGGLHGGAVAAIAEAASIACARTVVAERIRICFWVKWPHLISLLHAKLIVNASVMRSGRNMTVIGMEFRMRETSMFVYAARATFYTISVAIL